MNERYLTINVKCFFINYLHRTLVFFSFCGLGCLENKVVMLMICRIHFIFHTWLSLQIISYLLCYNKPQKHRAKIEWTFSYQQSLNCNNIASLNYDDSVCRLCLLLFHLWPFFINNPTGLFQSKTSIYYFRMARILRLSRVPSWCSKFVMFTHSSV